jgi:hypothetical protein
LTIQIQDLYARFPNGFHKPILFYTEEYSFYDSFVYKTIQPSRPFKNWTKSQVLKWKKKWPPNHSKTGQVILPLA